MTFRLRHLIAAACLCGLGCWLGFHPVVAALWGVGLAYLWADQHRPDSPLDALERTHHRITKETSHDG